MPTNCDNVTTLPISPHSHPGPRTLACVGAGLTATTLHIAQPTAHSRPHQNSPPNNSAHKPSAASVGLRARDVVGQRAP